MGKEWLEVFVKAVEKKNYLENLILLAGDNEFEAECRNDMDEIDRIVERYKAGEINRQCAEYLIETVGKE